MKLPAALFAALVIVTGSAGASETFEFVLDGLSLVASDFAACQADPASCLYDEAPFHQVFDYTVPGDGDWSLPHGELSVSGGQVIEFFQNLGTCDVFADDWSTWHDCSHGQLAEEGELGYGHDEVYAAQPGAIVSGWTGSLTVTSSVSTVSEPAAPVLMMLGIAVLAAQRRRSVTAPRWALT